MQHLKIFINLTRLNKPIGFMLLFWPCSWGLAFGYNLKNDLSIFIYYLVLFFLGSVLMRSAGCIFNDIVDKDFDKKVKRTKYRPVASNKISVTKAFFYVVVLCFLAFLILIQFNFFTICLGLGSMFLAFAYPFMKRITYWPQLFLGITFNWGILMAGTAINNHIGTEILLLYISAIFWTLGYDTIYGLQDIKDDEIIGMKSTSIKFKKNPKFFVSVCYSINILILAFLFRNIELHYLFIFLSLIYISTLFYQIIIFNKKNPNSCLKAFKTNNLSGLTLFVIMMTI